jgi:hypothetical protein
MSTLDEVRALEQQLTAAAESGGPDPRSELNPAGARSARERFD